MSRSNPIKTSATDKITNWIIYIFLALFVFSTIYPFWHVLMYSVSDSGSASTGGLFFYPRDFTLLAYKMLFKTKTIFTAYGNTIGKTLFGTAISVVLTALTAYPLSLQRFKGRKIISMMIFLTMLFSGGIIPTFLLIKDIGLLDKFWVYILPGAMSAYNMFILRSFFQTIPPSLEESAHMDGANSLQILYKIVIPLSLPSLAAIAMFYGVGNWNSYMDGVLYINNPKLQLLQVYLLQLIASSGAKGALSDVTSLGEASKLTDETMKMTTIAVSVIPVLFVYPFLQKYYVKGVMIGSVKG